MKKKIILSLLLIGIIISKSSSFKDSVKLIKENKFEQAQIILEELYKKSPEDVYILNNLGVVFLEKNQYNKAERFFNKALDIKKDFKSAFMNLGILYYYREDWYTLIKHSFSGIDLFPEERNIIDLIISYSYYRVREFKKAKDVFNKVESEKLKNNQIELYKHLKNKLRLITE
ncbi:MAG: hypothetical protein C0601_12160 [Candidatus Muiribacterium halophilum]|uniref:Uncharacterized protein n=1 Tax=Muiribacterium halophilum TaxID=2053465 RepID=A0A2N5ZAN3_MUIH1|nr:MAG: hypothetical protein C0601_12160 [Candidatus Muirbacterium halophilum]